MDKESEPRAQEEGCEGRASIKTNLTIWSACSSEGEKKESSVPAAFRTDSSMERVFAKASVTVKADLIWGATGRSEKAMPVSCLYASLAQKPPRDGGLSFETWSKGAFNQAKDQDVFVADCRRSMPAAGLLPSSHPPPTRTSQSQRQKSLSCWSGVVYLNMCRIAITGKTTHESCARGRDCETVAWRR